MKKIISVKDIGINEKTKLMVIMPHPDDEAVFAAGFIMQVARVGAQIDVVCMTDGSKSSLRYGLKPDGNLVEMRKKELENACRLMGAKTMICANFVDGELPQDFDDMLDFLYEEIQHTKPDIILTLEPDGVYGHPDHIALTQAVTQIYESHQYAWKLLYVTVPENFTSSASATKMAEKAEIKPLKPTHQLQLSLFDEYSKQQVCMAHYSQLGEHVDFWKRWDTYGLMKNEYFVVVG